MADPTPTPVPASPGPTPTPVPASQAPPPTPTPVPASQAPPPTPTPVPASQAPPPTPTPVPASQAPPPTPTPVPACTPDTLDAAGKDADTGAGTGQVGESAQSCSAAQPNAHISVHVQTSGGNPVDGVTVGVDGHGWSGVTDADGDFDFGEVPPDTYTVTGELVSGNVSQTQSAPAGADTQYTLTVPMAQIS